MASNRAVDPTRTLGLRRRFEADLYNRFRKLKGLVREALVKDRGLTTNIVQEGQFDFPTSEAKIGAFMAWLRRMEARSEIALIERPRIGGIDNRWANVYISAAYQKGQRRARAEMSRQGLDIPEQTAFNQPVHADRVGVLYSRVYSGLEGITEAMDAQISRVLADGILNGENPIRIAGQINERIDKIGITRARTLARTEVIRAHHLAGIQEYRNAGVKGVRVMAEWLTAGDGRVCQRCLDMASRKEPFTLAEIEPLIPLHPNCFIAGTEVQASKVKAATKRWFDGEGVTVCTAAGKEFTCTPNHPILTNKGWVPAGRLNESHYTICSSPSDGGLAVGSHDYDMQASIEKAPSSAFEAGRVSSKEVKTAAPDFHGDGIDDQIAVVYSDLHLSDRLKSSRAEGFKNQGLVPTVGHSSGSFTCSSCHQSVNADGLSFDGSMSGSDLGSSLVRTHLLPLEPFRFALSSALDSVLIKNASNYIARHVKMARDFVFGPTRSIHGDDFRIREIKGVRTSRLNAVRQQYALDNLVSNPKLAAQIRDCAPRGVFLDKVVGVNSVRLSCHVYNLQTASGAYVANGVLSHNCRCVALPVLEDE